MTSWDAAVGSPQHRRVLGREPRHALAPGARRESIERDVQRVRRLGVHVEPGARERAEPRRTRPGHDATVSDARPVLRRGVEEVHAGGSDLRDEALVAAHVREELLDGATAVAREIGEELKEELIEHARRPRSGVAQEPREGERDRERQPSGAERVDGGEREQPQQLLPQHAREEMRERRAVVRRRHRHDGAHGARARFDVGGRRQRDAGRHEELRVEPTARMAHDGDVARGLLEERDDGLAQERGAPRQRRGRFRGDDGHVAFDAEGRPDLGEQVLHVPEVGEVAEVRETEEAGDEHDVARAGHGASVAARRSERLLRSRSRRDHAYRFARSTPASTRRAPSTSARSSSSPG